MKYTQEEVREAIKEQIVRFNKWIDELSQKHEVELRQVLSEAFDEAVEELTRENLNERK